MDRTACQYAIVRFSPFVETGEFANVGILMMAPKKQFFGFKLETQRYARVTDFFGGLKPELYRQTLFALRNEFERVHEVLNEVGFEDELANRIFARLIRTRESIVRFSMPRLAVANDPGKKLDELFALYVGRNFITAAKV